MIKNLFDLLKIVDLYLDYLQDKIDFNNDGFPMFTKEMFLDSEPDLIVPFYNRNNKIVKDPSKTVLCFFGSDLMIYSRLGKVLREIDDYKRFQGIVGFGYYRNF